MKLTQISQTRGDCTASYNVTDYKSTTVGEFIDEVLKEFPSEWGEFRDEYDNQIAKYNNGTIVATNFSAVRLIDRRIVKIVGDGGWSRMDYLITIED